MFTILWLLYVLISPSSAIGNIVDFQFHPPSPWFSDGRKNTDHISFERSADWFRSHKVTYFVYEQLGLGIRGKIPVQSVRATPIGYGWLLNEPAQNCSFAIEDLRAELPDGEVRHRDGVMVCPRGWECKPIWEASLRQRDKNGNAGENPRRMALCVPPDRRQPAQMVLPYSGDCLDSNVIGAGTQYITAELFDRRKRRRFSNADRGADFINLDDDEPQNDQPESSHMPALRAETGQSVSTLLTLNDIQTPAVVRRETNNYQISMRAQAGHRYKACLVNERNEVVTLTFVSGTFVSETIDQQLPP